MSGLSERIRQIKARVQDLNTRVDNFANITAEPDTISSLKRNLVTGPIVVIGIKSLHQDHGQAIGKITITEQQITVDIYIDDILEYEFSELSYRFTNIDLKMTDTEIVGIIYQNNGIIRVEKINLVYSKEYKQYTLKLQPNQPFNRERIFIHINFGISQLNYSSRPVNLEPLPVSSNPGSGTGCRPEPTSMADWAAFERLSILKGPILTPTQNVINPFK